MKIRICAAQMKVRPWEVERNLQEARRLVRKASEQSCDVICFPELFLTGPPRKDIHRFAEGIPGRHTDEFCRLAEQYSIHVVMGSMIERDGELFYNTSVLIDASGNILGKYRKVNLWNGEKDYCTPGNTMEVFETSIGRVGLQICWDLAFPEMSMAAVRQGAQIIFCPSYWSHEDKYDIAPFEETDSPIAHVETEPIFVDSCVPARSIENGVAYVYVNACGATRVGARVRNMMGHSQIAVPFHGRIALLKDEEELLIREVDLTLSDVAETVYEIRKSRRERRMMLEP